MRLLRNDLTCYDKAIIAIRKLYLLHGPLHRCGPHRYGPHRYGHKSGILDHTQLLAEISGHRIRLRIEWSGAVIGSGKERSRAQEELSDQWRRNAFKDANQARSALGLADKLTWDIVESQKNQVDDLVKETANKGLKEGPYMKLMNPCSCPASSDGMLQVLRDIELQIKMVTKEVVAIHQIVKAKGKRQAENDPKTKHLENGSEEAQAAEEMQSTPNSMCTGPEETEETESDSDFTEAYGQTPDIESVDSTSARSTHSGGNDSVPELVGGDDFESKVDHLETDGW